MYVILCSSNVNPYAQVSAQGCSRICTRVPNSWVSKQRYVVQTARKFIQKSVATECEDAGRKKVRQTSTD